MSRKLTIEQKAISWALKGQHLRVYPEIVDETYAIKKSINGGKVKKYTINKVRLIIEIGNGRHTGSMIYKQGQEMTDAINKIYVHYYEKRADKKVL